LNFDNYTKDILTPFTYHSPLTYRGNQIGREVSKFPVVIWELMP